MLDLDADSVEAPILLIFARYTDLNFPIGELYGNPPEHALLEKCVISVLLLVMWLWANQIAST